MSTIFWRVGGAPGLERDGLTEFHGNVSYCYANSVAMLL